MHSRNPVALSSLQFHFDLQIHPSILQQEVNEVKEKKKSHLLNILRFAHDKWFLVLFALIFAILKGFMFPIFSIIYGSMFEVTNQ